MPFTHVMGITAVFILVVETRTIIAEVGGAVIIGLARAIVIMTIS